MMEYKIKKLKTFTSFSLESLVPEDNFYRQVEQCVDLSFVRTLVCHLYSDFGRPSIDPVVFFKLQLIAFFERIRSDRLLMETVSLNLAHRWFIGCDLDEDVPDHSSLSKIRERYGMQIFKQFFEQIVELCLEAGLIWGEELYFDSTKVGANAAINSMIDRTDSEVDQHIEELWKNGEESSSTETLQDLVEKNNGERFIGLRIPSYKRFTDEKVSLTDPDAALMWSQGGAVLFWGIKIITSLMAAKLVSSSRPWWLQHRSWIIPPYSIWWPEPVLVGSSSQRLPQVMLSMARLLILLAWKIAGSKLTYQRLI